MEKNEDFKKGVDYLTHFNPDDYINMYYSDLGENTVEGGLLPFILTQYNSIFKTGNIKGRSVLDIGTGPVPHSVISATPYVQEIYLTDYSPTNRKYLHDWLLGNGKQTFSNLFEYLTTLENQGETWMDRSDEMKSKVVGIFPVDVLEEDIMYGCLFPKFDLITSSLCIEAAVSTAEEWEMVANRVSKLLKPNGHLILDGVLLQTYYFVGDHKFFSCSTVDPDKLKKCWENAGFVIQSYKEFKTPPEDNRFSDFQVLFVMHCVKSSE